MAAGGQPSAGEHHDGGPAPDPAPVGVADARAGDAPDETGVTGPPAAGAEGDETGLAADAADDGPEAAGRDGVVLPAPVRQRVVESAAAAMEGVPPAELPATLRPFARFARSRRARAAAGALAAALDTDPVFRQKVADHARSASEALADAVAAGRVPPASPPVEVAALAYLIRPPGWQATVGRAAEDLNSADAAAADAAREEALVSLRAQLDAARASSRDEADRVRAELAGARREVDDLRRRLREANERAAASSQDVLAAQRAADQARQEAAAAVAAMESEARRLRGRLDDAEAAVETARRAAREGRDLADTRLRMLLDVLLGAARGLQTELALPPLLDRPADLVASGLAAQSGNAAARGLAGDDPALLDQLLGAPGAHLIVDGYNVTKTGYGTLTLEAQRHRLVTGLAALAAQTSAEVTVVFDGAERTGPLAVPQPRGVRVLFSPAGETADEVIRQLARAEPPGRPVVVVSSDREVADGVRRAGARPVPSLALLRRLDRG